MCTVYHVHIIDSDCGFHLLSKKENDQYRSKYEHLSVMQGCDNTTRLIGSTKLVANRSSLRFDFKSADLMLMTSQHGQNRTD